MASVKLTKKVVEANLTLSVDELKVLKDIVGRSTGPSIVNGVNTHNLFTALANAAAEASTNG